MVDFFILHVTETYSQSLANFELRNVNNETTRGAVISFTTNQTDSEDSLVDDSDVDKDYVPESHQSSEESNDMEKDPPYHQQRNVLRQDISEQEPPSSITNEPVKKSNTISVFARKLRAERKHRRNTGKNYTTAKGKEVKARMSKPLKDCRMKCKQVLEVVHREKLIREQIFDEFWALGDRNRRVAYVAGLVESKEPAVSRKRTDDPDKEKHRKVTNVFHFKVDGKLVKVCRDCFIRTLDVTQMFVTLAILNQNASVSGAISNDKRGRHSPHNKHSVDKLNEIRQHISSFPTYESHYTRRKSTRLYLPAHLDLTVMYKLYCENQETPVSRPIYEREFHKMNISFKKPKVDTCHKCDLLNTKIRITENDDEKKRYENELALHHEEADAAYLAKDKDKKLAKEDDTARCYSFDMQQCLPTPFLNTSVSFYKRQLWTFNLTMHETSSKDVTCYMWNETDGGRGANQVGTCIYKELITLPPQVTHVTLYSDTCGGQNRNSHVAAMFLFAIQENKKLEVIDHKFMVSGHSHLDCDVDHGLIEKQKKKLQFPIYHPHDWSQLIRSVGKTKKFLVRELTYKDFFDFAGLWKTSLLLRKKDAEGNPFSWHSVKWLRYTRVYGVIHFKTTLKEDVPFKTLCVRRRGKENIELLPSKCYNNKLSITKEKKKDILDMLPLIPTTFHQFYHDMQTSNIQEVYPDIEIDDEDCD